MASIKKLDFGKSVIFEWDTGALNTLVFDPEHFKDIFRKYIYPKLNVIENITRDDVAKLLRCYIVDDTIDSQQKLIDFIVTIRLTRIINYPGPSEDHVSLVRLYHDEYINLEKELFWGYAQRFNQSTLKQYRMPKICFVIFYYSYLQKNVAVSYLGAEIDDDNSNSYFKRLQRNKYAKRGNKKCN